MISFWGRDLVISMVDPRVEKLERELEERQAEFDDLTLEMALSVSEFFQVLRELMRGNYSVRASEDSSIEVFAELGKSINQTIETLARSEAALRASEERFRTLAELLPVGIFELGADGKYKFVNREVSRMTGYSVQELLDGVNPFDLVVEEHRPLLEKMLGRILSGETVKGVEYNSLRKDGTTFPSLGYGSVVKDGDRDVGVRGIVVDVTESRKAEEERARLEEQVQHSQKLESLGVLAGGIAHDFNNLLTGILGNSELAMRHLAGSSPGMPYLNDVVDSADKAAELCRQMLAYSGKGRFVVKALDLREEIKGMLHLIKVLMSKKVDLVLHFSDEIPTIRGDGAQIRQVIMNLLINASEAIGDDKGVVGVTIGTMECDREHLSGAYFSESLEEGRYVSLEVKDTGCGMDPDTRSRIFDPFFSTKFTGRGLGLSAVMGIVRGHSGAMFVESELGGGTSFKVLFPAQDEPPEVEKGDVARPEIWKGSGTVLLVDDEESVREVGKRLLKELGFDVILASDGEEAVSLFSTRMDRIVCVVLDLTMPRMDGREAFIELRRMRPDLPIVLSSGYNEQKIVNEFVGKDLTGFIQKPYRLMEFAEKIRGAITGVKARG